MQLCYMETIFNGALDVFSTFHYAQGNARPEGLNIHFRLQVYHTVSICMHTYTGTMPAPMFLYLSVFFFF